MSGDETPAAKTGAFAALKKRMRGTSGASATLADLIKEMTVEDPADREVDLREVARALDEAASEARAATAAS